MIVLLGSSTGLECESDPGAPPWASLQGSPGAVVMMRTVEQGQLPGRMKSTEVPPSPRETGFWGRWVTDEKYILAGTQPDQILSKD